MDDPLREQILADLAAAFDAVGDVTPSAGQPLHVRFKVELPEPWTPSPMRALTVWDNWPSERPLFYIDCAVTGEHGQAPRNPSATFVLGETWNAFSFSFPWKGGDPVRAVRMWLTRFEVERT